MERARRIGSLWNWLPVFRAVAETENLHAAAASLHVSPSAVSRTVKLLEEDVGHALFVRRGRAVRLNDQGRALLVSVRDAMRLVDDGVTAMSASASLRSLRVACSGDHALALLGRPVLELRARHPQLAVDVVRLPGGDVASLLLRGDLDLLLGHDAVHAPGLVALELGRVGHGLYCRRAHPLATPARDSLSVAEVARYPLLAVPDEGASRERWIPELRGAAVLSLPALAPAIELCAASNAIAVLPEAAAPSSLLRLPLDVASPTMLRVTYREPLLGADVCASLARDLIVEAARRALVL